eukprot:7176480-Lingulodinium_polyedra.AAC.1
MYFWQQVSVQVSPRCISTDSQSAKSIVLRVGPGKRSTHVETTKTTPYLWTQYLAVDLTRQHSQTIG